MLIVLCGLMLFVMLFEARGRYLFLYLPVFLILALCGCEECSRKLSEKWSACRSRRW